MEGILDIVTEIGIGDIIDILIMSFIIYSTIVWFKRTKAIFIVMGMFILGLGYLVARELDLTLTVTVLQAFFAVFLIAVVVIFQEEIKQFFESLAHWTASRTPGRKKALEIPLTQIGILSSTLAELAEDRIGALVVIQGKDPVVRHLAGGITLNGEISEPLLESLFDPHSIGHDGAVVIAGNRITEFSAHLPLSKNLKALGKAGTRHAAALGLSEVSDALCIVVSEERGTISIARHGELTVILDRSTLLTRLEEFFHEIVPVQERKPWRDFFRKNYQEKGIAVAVTLLLWFVFDHESRIDYRTFEVPVTIAAISHTVDVATVDPANVSLIFSAPRRAFYFVDEGDLSVHLRVLSAKGGVFPVQVSQTNVSFPSSLIFEGSEPEVVHVTLGEKRSTK